MSRRKTPPVLRVPTSDRQALADASLVVELVLADLSVASFTRLVEALRKVRGILRQALDGHGSDEET